MSRRRGSRVGLSRGIRSWSTPDLGTDTSRAAANVTHDAFTVPMFIQQIFHSKMTLKIKRLSVGDFKHSVVI